MYQTRYCVTLYQHDRKKMAVSCFNLKAAQEQASLFSGQSIDYVQKVMGEKDDPVYLHLAFGYVIIEKLYGVGGTADK